MKAQHTFKKQVLTVVKLKMVYLVTVVSPTLTAGVVVVVAAAAVPPKAGAAAVVAAPKAGVVVVVVLKTDLGAGY